MKPSRRQLNSSTPLVIIAVYIGFVLSLSPNDSFAGAERAPTSFHGKLRLSALGLRHRDGLWTSPESLKKTGYLPEVESDPLSQGFKAILVSQRSLGEAGQKYQSLTKGLEERRLRHLEGLSDQAAFDQANRDIAATYLRNAMKDKYREWRRLGQRDFKASWKDSRRESRRTRREIHPMAGPGQDTTALADEVGNHDNKVSLSQNDSASSREASAGEMVESALQSLWRMSERMLHDYQAFGLWADAETRLRYDWSRNTGEMAFVSNLFHAQASHRFIDHSMPFTPRQSFIGKERTTFGISRGFEELAAQTAISYGLDSSMVQWTIVKRVAGPVDASVHQQIPTGAGVSNTTFQLSLGMTF